jgi:hypothetical protein
VTTRERAVREVDTRGYEISSLLDGKNAEDSKLAETVTKLLVPQRVPVDKDEKAAPVPTFKP